jgi:hypothetical protein
MMNSNDLEQVELDDEILEVMPPRSRPGVVVSVRLGPDDAETLHELADRRRTTLSEIAREAITTYLHRPGARLPRYDANQTEGDMRRSLRLKIRQPEKVEPFSTRGPAAAIAILSS